MAWIQTIDEKDAIGLLAQAYRRVAGERGKVSNIMKAQSLHPRALKAHLDLYVSLMFGESEFTREEREIIATVSPLLMTVITVSFIMEKPSSITGKTNRKSSNFLKTTKAFL